MMDDVNFSLNIKSIKALSCFNLQWYKQVMRDILFRYKILFIFLIAMFAPSLSSLYSLIIMPASSLLTPHSNIAHTIFFMFVYQLISLIWITMHNSVFSRKLWSNYLISLPVTQQQKFIADLILLTVIDIIIFTPFMLGLVLLKDKISAIVLFSGVVKFIVILLLIIFLQQIWIFKKYKFLFLVFFFDGVFSLVDQVPNLKVQAGLSAILVMTVLFCYKTLYKLEWVNFKENTTKNNRCFSFFNIFPFVQVQIKNLADNYRYLMVTSFGTLVVLLVSLCFILNASNNTSLQFILSIFMLINSLQVSNLFCKLKSQRDIYSSYFKSLPIEVGFLFLSDFSISLFILTCINLLILLMTLFFGELNLTMCFSLIVSIIFLALTYYPQTKFKRYGFLVSLGMMSIFAYCEYFIF